MEMTIFVSAKTQAEIAQLVEHQLPKLRAAGSNPVFRSTKAADVENICGFVLEGEIELARISPSNTKQRSS